MTPKEKAEDLVGMYKVIFSYKYDITGDEEENNFFKQSAMVAVGEIMGATSENANYWQNVISEIRRIKV
jgi:hypothetical protein